MSKPKGKTTARGYGSRHQSQRRAIAERLANGVVLACWRCGGAITRETPWDLGHDDDDRTVYRGPEHRACNRSAGAIKGNRARGVRRRMMRNIKDANPIDLW